MLKKTPKSFIKNMILSENVIERRIYFIRGEKVILDEDLAELYGVKTSILNKAVKRNADRFPKDFMFQLTNDENTNLRFQVGISSTDRHGGRRYLPHVFTEQGVAMLSGVLNSKSAIAVNIAIMRSFVRLRKLITGNEELTKKFNELEKITNTKLKKHDEQIQTIFEVIKKLITTTIPKSASTKPTHIGFRI